MPTCIKCMWQPQRDQADIVVSGEADVSLSLQAGAQSLRFAGVGGNGELLKGAMAGQAIC